MNTVSAVDQLGFDEAMAEQRERGRTSARFDASIEQSANVDSDVSFTGYTAAEGAAEVLSLFEDGTEVDSLAEGSTGIVVLNETAFLRRSWRPDRRQRPDRRHRRRRLSRGADYKGRQPTSASRQSRQGRAAQGRPA